MLWKRISWIILLIITAQACKKSADIPMQFPEGSNESINTWILDSLKRYYYWNEQLPLHPDKTIAPIDFFRSVIYKEDRFSSLSAASASSKAPPVSSLYGFDYALIRADGSQQLVGLIKHVFSDSPASRSGLSRGMYFTKVNARPWTTSSSASIQQDLVKQRKIVLTIAERQGTTFEERENLEVTAGYSFEQKPQQQVFDLQGKRIAYLYLNDFIPGTARVLYPIFAIFKNQSASDLILDLRYNSGGQVAEAAALCALITGLPYNSPFIQYKGNKNAGIRMESIGESATFDQTVIFHELQQHSLNLKRLFILSSKATASASEIIINNLKPYLEIYLIGEPTLGKDMASFTIDDQNSPKTIDWKIQPVIYKLYNARQEGDYSNGIQPSSLVDEMENLPLQPIGDLQDPLIAKAITQIANLPPKLALLQKTRLPFARSKKITLLYDSKILQAQQSSPSIQKR